MATLLTISKMSNGWLCAAVAEKYSTPLYYGENVAQALCSAPEEVKAHIELIESLIARPEAVEVIINNYERRIEVCYIYGKYRRVIPKSAPSLGEALEKLVVDVRKMNI